MSTLQKIIISVMSYMLLTGCVTTSLQMNKGNKMKEIAPIVVQNYEEYLKLKYCPLNEDMIEDGEVSKIVYLKDGTKVEYFIDTIGFENIYTKKLPFIEIKKSYSPATKQLKYIVYTVGNIHIKSIEYGKDGQVLKVNEYKERKGKLPYEYILKWAEKEGILSIKDAIVFNGNEFDLEYTHTKTQEIKELYTKNFGKKKITKEKIEKVLSYGGFWTFTLYSTKEVSNGKKVNFSQEFFFSDGGDLFYSGGVELYQF